MSPVRKKYIRQALATVERELALAKPSLPKLLKHLARARGSVMLELVPSPKRQRNTRVTAVTRN